MRTSFDHAPGKQESLIGKRRGDADFISALASDAATMIRRSSLFIRSRDLAVLLLCASSLATAAAEDSLSANLRFFNYRFSVERDVNPATADPGFAGAFAPALSTRSPQTITASKAMTLPEKRAGDLSEMLQTHEFSFGASALRTLGMDNLGSGSAENVTFKAVKLRASRSKVMLRADFTFK